MSVTCVFVLFRFWVVCPTQFAEIDVSLLVLDQRRCRRLYCSKSKFAPMWTAGLLNVASKTHQGYIKRLLPPFEPCLTHGGQQHHCLLVFEIPQRFRLTWVSTHNDSCWHWMCSVGMTPRCWHVLAWTWRRTRCPLTGPLVLPQARTYARGRAGNFTSYSARGSP